MSNNICPICTAYMLDMHRPIGWKKCLTCAYCHDQNGENRLTKLKEFFNQQPALQGEANEPAQSKNAPDTSTKKTSS